MKDETVASLTQAWAAIVATAGTPRVVLSDNTKNFCSKQFRELLNKLGAARTYITTYHAQANPTERLNKTIIQRLVTAILESGEDWDQIVSYTATAYNQTPHAAIGKSPYERMFGHAPRLPASSPLQHVATMATDDAVADQHLRMKAGWEAAAKLIEKGQVAQKTYYDRWFAKDHKFKQGERVFLFDPSCKQSKPGKLAVPFEGPFEILSINEPNVRLKSHQGQEFMAHISNLSKPTKEYLESGQIVHSTRRRPYREDPPQHRSQSQPNTVAKQTDKNSAASESHRPRFEAPEQKQRVVPDSPFAPKKSRSNQ